jgi:hypothetical protein
VAGRAAQVVLVGAGALGTAGSATALTGPVLTTENAVAYFALRDLALATGDTSYASTAVGIRDSLLRNHWSTATRRFARGIGDGTGSLRATVYGGLFLLAVGERGKARDVVRHLRHYRLKGAQIDAFHVDGPADLIGYRPYGDGYLVEQGTPPNGPQVIDQAGSWAAALLKARYGEPIGEDVRSLARWRFNHDDSSYLFGSQWLNYSTDSSPGDSTTLRARPYLGSAAWAYLLARGAQDLLTPDPLPVPAPTGLVFAARYDYAARRMVLTGTWGRDFTVPCAAYEAVLEQSTNSGVSWSQTLPTSRNSIERARSGSGYRFVWTLRMPSNLGTRYRMRLRLRNARFGAWVTSGQVSPPTI